MGKVTGGGSRDKLQSCSGLAFECSGDTVSAGEASRVALGNFALACVGKILSVK